MKSSRLLKVFEDYIKKIDMNNAYAKAKYFHSLKSMDLARNIASELGIFDEDEIVIIELIALFHDIGNFNEDEYDIKFQTDEMINFQSVSQIYEFLKARAVFE